MLIGTVSWWGNIWNLLTSPNYRGKFWEHDAERVKHTWYTDSTKLVEQNDVWRLFWYVPDVKYLARFQWKYTWNVYRDFFGSLFPSINFEHHNLRVSFNVSFLPFPDSAVNTYNCRGDSHWENLTTIYILFEGTNKLPTHYWVLQFHYLFPDICMTK